MEEVNTLWHFGDSFACWGNVTQPDKEAKKGFSEYIAEYYNCKFEHHGVCGYSNELILNKIINQLNEFKSNDIIIINWSFFTRFTYSDVYDKPKSFNFLQNEINTNSFLTSFELLKKNYSSLELVSSEYLEYLIMHKSNFAYSENIVLWKTIINPILINLQNKKCKIVNCFNDNFTDTPFTETNDPNSVIDIEHKFLDKTLYKINWREPRETGGEYIHFLRENAFYGEDEDVHYKFGVQQELADEWIGRINTKFFSDLI